MNNCHYAIENINIDLHIHSFASFYKDGEIVNDSTEENSSKLISSLESKHINLFAITDHNRFDYSLYCKLKEEIKSSEIIKNVLPGIEFDVQLEEGYPKCHIISIFDDSDVDKLKEIPNAILSIGELKKKDDFYKSEDFEKLLRKIGLKTILIVHQKQALDNKTGRTDSLSAACEDPSYFIKTGYIDSLEYGSSRTEGILRDSLRSLDISFPLITGSDCHQWEAYPYRDLKSKKIERKFTSIKCLPSFKGLLMAISSFGSRANRNSNTNQQYIEKIKLGDVEIPLANGINAIIGDNGSGKSLLLNLLCNGEKKYYDKIVKENNLSYSYNDISFQKEKINYIPQGNINKQVREGNLFDKNSDYYDEITTKTLFSESIFNFFDGIDKYVMKNIKLSEQFSNLKNKTISIVPVKRSFYLPVIDSSINLENIESDKERKNSLKTKLDLITNEYESYKSYYKNLSVDKYFEAAIENLSKVYKIVLKSYTEKDKRNKAKSIISGKLNAYSISLTSRRTSEESKNKDILDSYTNFKNDIVNYIKLKNNPNLYPKFPNKTSGIATKQVNDYEFTKTTNYNDVDLNDEFYKYCFNSDYNNEKKIMKISSRDSYKDALKGCTSLQELEKYKNTKIQGFVDEYSKENTFISEVTSKSSVGNTPGEISLVYYKFLIQEKESEFCVLAIDQPEDDINPKRIKEFLLQYLGSIRDKKQVLLVTHNPLLVVNLDVDNVIYLNKENNILRIKYGALEYDEEYNILDLIKENLDGGYKAIEGRLKKYERDED